MRIFPAAVVVLACAVYPFLPVVWADALYHLDNLRLPASFPARTEYYAIDPVVQSGHEPGFLRFHVYASHGEYQIEGFKALAKLLYEVQVLERLDRGEDPGTGFVDGMGDTFAGVGRGLYDLLRHPVMSAKAAGRASRELARKTAGLFRRKESGEVPGWREKMLGASEREIAKLLAVDAYTTNPYLKERLVRMAKAREAGKWATLAPGLLVPLPGVISFAAMAGGVNDMADHMANDLGRGDLYRLNREALAGLGFAADEVKGLLNSPFYSPREATYLRFYLEAMKDVDGFRGLMDQARRVSSPGEARKVLYEMELLVAERPRLSRVPRIRCFPEGIAVIEWERMVLICPYDYLEHDALGESVLDRAGRLRREWGVRKAEVWNRGQASPAFKAEAEAFGIKVRDWAG